MSLFFAIIILRGGNEMKELLKRAWAEIDLDCLTENYNYIKNHVGGTDVMSIVKANAYGHGDEQVAIHLQSIGVKWFGVSNIEEALALRKYGITGEILILGHTPSEYADRLIANNITQTIVSLDFAKKLSRKAGDKKVRCHLKIDTGMTRIGIAPEIETAKEIYSLSGLDITGIFTHFADADSYSDFAKDFTKGQYDKFLNIINNLENEGINVGVKHCCNSGGTLLYPEMHLDLVRPGIIMYGVAPSDEVDVSAYLKPVFKLKSVISHIKTCPKGSYVSYGSTEVLEKDTKLATVPIGYADGYSRLLSSKGELLVGGKFARVVGRICMDQLMIDITGIETEVGDEVLIMGGTAKDGTSLDSIANRMGTIPYEIVCGINKRIPRVYIKNSEIYEITNYIL